MGLVGSEIVLIEKVNSLDFVDRVFDFYQQRQLFAIKDPAIDTSYLESSDVIEPKEGGGWCERTLERNDSSDLAQIQAVERTVNGIVWSTKEKIPGI